MLFGIFGIFWFFTCLERVGNGSDVTVRTKNLRGLGILFLQKKNQTFSRQMCFLVPIASGIGTKKVIFPRKFSNNFFSAKLEYPTLVGFKS